MTIPFSRCAFCWVILLLSGCARSTPGNNAPAAEEEPIVAPSRAPDLRLGGGQFRHQVRGRALVFSANGQSLFSGGTDAVIREWEIATGKMSRAFVGHTDTVCVLALAAGGKRLASGGREGAVRLWDLDSGKELWRGHAHSDAVETLEFARDGKTLLSAGKDHAVRLLDAATGREFLTFVKGEDARVTGTFCSDDETVVTTGHDDGRIRFWRASDGKEIRGVTPKVPPPGSAFGFSPDGKILLLGQTNIITLWDFKTETVCPQTLEPDLNVEAVGFSGDGKRIALAGWPGASVWDTQTGKRVMILGDHFDRVCAIVYSPDGKTIATGGMDGVIRLFDAATGRQFGAPEGHQARVSALSIVPDQTALISGGDDATVRFWDLPSGKLSRTLTWELDPDLRFREQTSSVTSVSVSSDGKRVVAGTPNAPVRIWSASDGYHITSLKPDENWGASALCFTQKGEGLLIASHNGGMGLCDVGTGKRLKQYSGRGPIRRRLALSSDETMFASEGEHNAIEIRSVKTGELLASMSMSAAVLGTDVITEGGYFVFSPDGKWIAAASWDGGVARPLRVFETTTGNEVLAFGEGGFVTALAVSPDGKTVAAGYTDSSIDFWDTTTGKRKEKFKTDQGAINCLAFTLDGKWLFSGGSEGTISGWKLKS